MVDQEAFWDELLSYIEARSVIAVVGPELIVVEHEGRVEPYRKVLARRLAIRLKLPDMGPMRLSSRSSRPTWFNPAANGNPSIGSWVTLPQGSPSISPNRCCSLRASVT